MRLQFPSVLLLRVVVTVLCLAVLSASQSPKSKGVPQQHSGKNAAPTNNGAQGEQPSATPPHQTIAIYGQPSPADNNGANKRSQDAIDVERQLAKFTWYLVLVGIFQCLVLLGQGILFFQQKRIMGEHKISLEQLATAAGNNAAAIQTQAGIMGKQLTSMNGQIAAIESQNVTMKESVAVARDSAAAAKTSADALINAERPWVTASVIKTVRELPGIEGRDFISMPKRKVTYFNFILKNLGRIPAEIIAIRGAPEITKEGINGRLDPNEEPDYGLPAMLPHVKMLAPQEEWEYDRLLTLFHYPPDQMERVRTERDHVIFAGVVLYTDALTPDVVHETRFCYTYLQGLDDYRPSGPPQYTKYT